MLLLEHLCSYGCGNKALYKMTSGKWCCCEKYTQCPANRKKNSITRKKQVHEQLKNGTYQNPFSEWSKTNKPWCTGLTLNTSEKIRKRSENYKQKYAAGLIKIKRNHPSKELREKLSKIRCEQLDKFHNGFPDVKFYKVNDLNGKEWTVRGTWELNIAKKLNELNIFWRKNTQIPYLDEINRRYNPDFYIPSLNEYIEVKGYFSPENKKKMNLVIEQYPGIKIRFICEKEYNNFINDKISYNDIPYYEKI